MEIWDLYNEKGEPTGKTIQRGITIPQGLFHRAVEIWIMNSKKEVLIQQRAWNKKTLPGYWGLTTGCVLVGESSLQACFREAQEELGLIIEPHEIALLCSMVHPPILWDLYLIRKDFKLESLVLQTEEVQDVCWVTTKTLRKMALSGQVYHYPELLDVISFLESHL